MDCLSIVRTLIIKYDFMSVLIKAHKSSYKIITFYMSFYEKQKDKKKQTTCIASGDGFYFVMPYFICLALLLR